jgi:multiple sugar transport system permease protein
MAVSRRIRALGFVLPWLIGMGLFTVYPFCASMYYSLTHFSVLQEPNFIGFSNYRELAGDEVFWKAVGNTFVYAGLAIPAGLVVSLSLAIVMNACKRGQVIYSVIFYLPHLIPGVVTAILWMWMFNNEFGLINSALQPFFDGTNWVRRLFVPDAVVWGPPNWLGSPTWALPALVLMALWGVGQTAFIYLAKLQDVPQELYEQAEIDGASTWQKIRHVTLPMISPIIFFNIVMGIIGAFQIFTEPYLISPSGGPARATYFLSHYIWDHAFVNMRMGYACAMAWLLFLIILALTILAFRVARDRVYYAGR